MKTTLFFALALCVVLVALGGQQGSYYLDSLNVRCHWQFHGDHELGGLVLAPDTTLWTCYPHTDTLIEIDASDPDVIDTNFYKMDTVLTGVYGVVDDSMLIATSFVSGFWYFRTININTSPPSIVASYTSPHLSCHRGATASLIIDSMFFTMDNTSIGDLAIFDLSDPTNIDTFSTGIDHAVGKWYEVIDSFLYSTFFQDTGVGPSYSPRYKISITNIADPYSPVYETTLTMISRESYSIDLPCPSVIHDTLMFVAANYMEPRLADVYNISDPTNPVYIGPMGPNTMLSKLCIIYENDYLYAGAWIQDMQGYPTNDSLVGYAVGVPTWMEVNGRYVYRITGASFVVLEFFEFDTLRQACIDEPSPRERWEDMFLFPNPAYEMCNIHLNNPSYGKINMYNILGQKVACEKTTPFRRDYSIRVSNIPAGVYLVSFQYGSEKHIKKLVILG